MTRVFGGSIRSRLFILVSLCIAFAHSPAEARAAGPTADRATSVRGLVKATSEFKAASSTYKDAVEDLLPAYEHALAAAKDQLATRTKLFDEGIVSRKELDDAEQAVRGAEQKLATARAQLAATDRAVAEAEARAEQATRAPAPPTGRMAARPAVIRSFGSSGWSLAAVPAVQAFFSGTFGRALPITAYGQSATHDRLGWDHRNAIDVGLAPDSREGQALIAYLKSVGVPFQAFRSAIPGVATGAHIHVGLPSHRLG